MSKHSNTPADTFARETDGYVRDASVTAADQHTPAVRDHVLPRVTWREVPDSVALADLSAGYDPGQSEHTADVRYLADALTRDLTSGVDED